MARLFSLVVCIELGQAFASCPDNEWSLVAGDDDRCCPATTAPAREAASFHKNHDQGWDICCFFSGCDLNQAVWDANGPNNGIWCSKSDYGHNGNSCKNSQGDWDFWISGFVFDNCPGQGSTCIAVENSDYWKNADGIINPSVAPDSKFLSLCSTAGKAKPVCTDNGYICAPATSGGTTCDDNMNFCHSADVPPTCWPESCPPDAMRNSNNASVMV